MGTFWSTQAAGSPAACRASADGLTEVGERLMSVVHRLPAGAGLRETWVGAAGSAAAVRLVRATDALSDIARRARGLAAALQELGSVLDEAAHELGAARALAASDGLVMDASGFVAHASHPAARAVAAARRREEAGHRELGAVILAVTEGGFGERLVTDVVTGVLHAPDGRGVLDETAWLVGLPGAAGLLSDGARASLVARGQVVVASAATSGHPLAVGAAAAVTRATPLARGAARAAGPVGSVLTVVTSGRDQWRDDADAGRYSTVDRVGRATVRAGLEGSTVLAGGFVGGQYGAALGSMVLPGAGTAVGAAVGAGIGAFVASEAGRATIDVAVDAVDDVIDLASEGIHTATEALGGVADVAEDVGDALCFWD